MFVASTNRSTVSSPTGHLLAALAALVVLCMMLGRHPISRTQEARVLESSRQMLDRGWHGWLVPVLNGDVRLQKPPLAYWITATSYRGLGISDAAGRLPTAIIGWLTLLATYAIARRAYDARVALYSAAILLGSYLFFRSMRLAETDQPTTLFLTIAIGSLWINTSAPRAVWFHIAAAATALAILSKGAPGILVLVFFVAYCWIERRKDLLWGFIRSGAPLTLLAIAAPWFIFLYLDQGDLNVIATELVVSTTGRNHFSLPFQYVPMLLVAAVPWSGFVPLAVYDAIRRWRTDASTRFVLIWFASIFIPLCLNGNKQAHYLLMLTPPLMILIGQMLARWPAELRRWNTWTLVGTVMVLSLGAVAVPVAGEIVRGHVAPLDIVLAMMILIAVVVLVRIIRTHGTPAGAGGLIAAAVLLLPLLQGIWLPTLATESMREMARDVHQKFGAGPYVFYGSPSNLTLCFELRVPIPDTISEQKLLALCPVGGFAITETKVGREPRDMPEGFKHVYQTRFDDGVFDFYLRQSPSDGS